MVNTSSRYFPICFIHVKVTSVHSSLEISCCARDAFGDGDFLCWNLVEVGARYCLRGEADTNIVLPAVLRLRGVACEGTDEAGLDERPLLVFNGDDLGLRMSSQAPSSEFEAKDS